MTRLNGEEMQRSGTDMLIHSIPAIIAFCSVFTPLAPGDVIATGTPDGIGAKRTPPVWMKAGDVLEVEISSIGTLRTRIDFQHRHAPHPHRGREVGGAEFQFSGHVGTAFHSLSPAGRGWGEGVPPIEISQ